MASTSFGKWGAEQRGGDIESGGGGSWLTMPFDTDSLLNSETMQQLSWNNMKASMESQMPKQVMGMGYQQRFKVCLDLLLHVFTLLEFF
jgi:hypothetical protein